MLLLSKIYNVQVPCNAELGKSSSKSVMCFPSNNREVRLKEKKSDLAEQLKCHHAIYIKELEMKYIEDNVCLPLI